MLQLSSPAQEVFRSLMLELDIGDEEAARALSAVVCSGQVELPTERDPLLMWMLAWLVSYNAQCINEQVVE